MPGQKKYWNEQIQTYFFDVEKRKSCPLKEGCYKEGAKKKTYSVLIKSDLHQEQITFQETDYYKEKAKHRYKIEAKNNELKMHMVMKEQYHMSLPICKCKVQGQFSRSI